MKVKFAIFYEPDTNWGDNLHEMNNREFFFAYQLFAICSCTDEFTTKNKFINSAKLYVLY